MYEIRKLLTKMVPDVTSHHFTPQRPRRHITLYLTGSWRNLILAKH